MKVKYNFKGLNLGKQKSVLLLKPFFIPDVEVVKDLGSLYDIKYYKLVKDKGDLAVFYGSFSIDDVISYRTRGNRMLVIMNSDSDYAYFVKVLKSKGLEIEDIFDGIAVLDINMSESDIRKTFKLVELEGKYNRLDNNQKRFLKDIKMLIDWGIHKDGFRVPKSWLKETYEIEGLVETDGEDIKVYADRLGYLIKTERNLSELMKVYDMVKDIFEPLYTLGYNLYTMVRGFEMREAEDFIEEVINRLFEISRNDSEYVMVLMLKSFVLSDIKRDYVNALTYMDEALNMARKLNNKSLLGRVLFNLGWIYNSLGTFYGNKGYFDKAYERIWEGYMLLGKDIKPEFYNFMVNYFREKGEMKKFLRWTYISMDKLRNLTRLRGVLTNNVILGLSRFDDISEEDKNKLEGFIFDTINNAFDNLDKRLKIQILVNFAFYLGVREKRYEESLKLLNKALDIDEEEGSKAFIMADKGYIYILMGDYNKAYENLRFSFEYCIRNIDIIPKEEFRFVASNYLHILETLGMDKEIEKVEGQLKRIL